VLIFNGRLISLFNKKISLAWLVGHRLLLRDFEPYGISFMNMHDVITAAMFVLLRSFCRYEIIFMRMCV
jgi:hypothetical protein